MSTPRTLDNLHPALRRCWHPVATAKELDAGPVKVTLIGDEFVVARLEGELTALPNKCAHRGAPLSAGTVVDGCLECAYHGYRYDSAGHCVRIPSQSSEIPIPARAHLPVPAGVTERYGVVWIAPEDPIPPLPECAEFGQEGWVAISADPQRWHAGAAQMQDNFIDYAHFAYRHGKTFGTADEIDISADPEVERDGWTFRGSHFHMVLDPEAPPGSDRKAQPRDFNLTYIAPFTLISRITYPNRNLNTVIFQTLQPETLDTTRAFGYMIRDDMAELGVTQIEAPPDFEDEISGEDRDLLEQFSTRAMPLDLNAELHTKADRHTVEMRRILSDLVDRAGADAGGA
jgi:phenylpropionate dioxygenase-like ring-hydroxylating dioxygenase large terminal subunit